MPTEANSINAATSGIVINTGTAFTATTTTNHNLLIGAASNAITNVAPSATSGVPVISQGAAADPAFGTAVVAGGGTGQTSLTAHDLLIGNGTSAVTLLAPSATSGVPLVSQGASADPAYTTAVVAGGGTGVTSATAYAVLCGGTTSTNPFQSIASVGTAGQVLASNGASALPTFQGITLVQQVRTSTSALVHCTTTLPIDDTIPQITEGTQVITITITPKNTANILVISCNLFAAINTSGDNWGVALFQDSTTNALAATFCTSPGAGNGENAVINYSMAAGTTSATTFKIRAGGNTNNLDVNGAGNNTRYFGGVANTYLQVTEYSS